VYCLLFFLASALSALSFEPLYFLFFSDNLLVVLDFLILQVFCSYRTIC
jgi:hypothetical protein